MAEGTQEESNFEVLVVVQANEIVQAKDILDKIKDGKPIEYDHVRIIGDIDISKADLSKDNGKFLISPIIKITDSVFDGRVSFSFSNFQNNVDFSFTKFTKQVAFNQSVFIRNINFIRTQFEGSAHFYWSEFKGRVAFMEAQFSGLATFYGSVFEEDTFFNKARFREDVTFEGSEFRKIAEFSNLKFDEKAIFNDSKFIGDVKFVVSKFGGFTNFRDCSFSQSLNLEGSNIYTMFLQSITLEKDSTLSLKYSEFFRLEIPWKIIRDKLEYDGSAYLALVKNYNNLEWHEDADACYYKYRIIKSRELKGVRKIFDFFLFYFYGYGIRPEYPLAAMAAIFAFSTLVYLLEGQASTTLDAAEISIKALTIQISTDLVGLCKWCSIAERILGWLLMSSFLVVLAKKTLR